MKAFFFFFVLTFTASSTTFGQDGVLEKGNALLSKGNIDGAEKVFRDGINANPNNLILQCQLGLTLTQKGKYSEADSVLARVLKSDPQNIGANWYSGICSFKDARDRDAVERFEKVLPLLDRASGQYFGANWFLGKCYSNLLKTEGLTYQETNRMFECYEEYLRLQPNAKDSQEIREYVDRNKKRRPSDNVLKWIDL